MEDNLHADLEAAFDAAPAETVTAEAPAQPDAPEPSEALTTEQKAERARDEAGRFAKAQKQEQQKVEPKQEPQAAPQVQQAQPNAAPSPRGAPSAWKPEAKAVWEKAARGEPITLEEFQLVQDESLRRESDFHKGLEGFKSHAEKGRIWDKTLAPYQQTLQQLGVDGPTAVSALLQADHILRNAPESVKAQKLLEIAQQYGIDLSKQFSPDIAKYEQELYQTKEQLRQIQQQAVEQTSMSLNSEIEKFASAPGHEHFEAVRDHMASLLAGGAAKDLDEAYDMAVYANPTTRAAMLEQQRRSQEEAARAQRASAAAVSVRGSSPANGAPSAAKHESIRGAVEAAFENHS